MNVWRIMEDVMNLGFVQIYQEVSIANVKMDIQEMVLLARKVKIIKQLELALGLELVS